MSEFYVTTYCNHPHRKNDGKPIGHECYIIPPDALQAAIDGDLPKAIALMEAAKKTYNIFHGKTLRPHAGLRI